jgi:hypothetical protein
MIPFSSTYTAIHRIVNHATRNEKKQCFFVNLTNNTFWTKTPNGAEILKFFTGMTISQIINFFGFFDIFVIGFHNGINGHLYMTADPSSPNFKQTIRFSISKGYKLLKKSFSGRATLSVEIGDDLRGSIGSIPVQSAGFSTSPASGFESPSMESAFKQGLSTFGSFQCFGAGAGPAIQPVSLFQAFGGFASEFSLFRAQPPSIGGYFQPIVQGVPTDPFTSQENFISVESTDGPLHRQEKTCLEIRKGRVCRVEIPSDCSSGPSTSSTVGIAKSPKAQTPTPIATTIANLEKKIARLERGNSAEGSPDYLTLVVSKAKLKKIQN